MIIQKNYEILIACVKTNNQKQSTFYFYKFLFIELPL